MSSLKVKIFTHCTQHINPYNETQINEWLAGNPDIEIAHMLQSESMISRNENQVDRNLSISIFYREPE
jgi:hypothetical protein